MDTNDAAKIADYEARVLNIGGYLRDKEAGVARVVMVQGNVLLARKAFDSLSGKPAGLTAVINIENLKERAASLRDRLANLDQLIADAEAAEEVASQ